ncbi:MAG: ornithine cyclodeaminase family protein [Candidatus Hodarchaeales archaeon]|jgi:ornithine cyclodeaminase/alanine dehydrogenase
MGEVLILSRKDVESVLNMKDTIEVMKSAFSELSEGTAILPQRIVIPAEEQKGLSLYMPAFLPKTGSLAVKVVTVFKKNPEKYDLPTTLGKVLLQDINTGDVICIMDGGYLTAMRTGAVSGCAIEYLAKKDAKIVGLFGTGVQGQTQLWAACEARPSIELCKVYDLRKEVAIEFANKMSEKLKITIEVAGSAEETIKGSDIILTATTSPDPIFKGEWLEPGTHVSGVGSHSPGTRELDTETIKRAKIVCDQVSACLTEAGDIIIPIDEEAIAKDDIYGELGEVVSGKKAGRENDTEITLFKSVGLAIQDAATAKIVYNKAREINKGITIKI